MSPNSYFTIFQPIGTHSKMLKVEYFSVAKFGQKIAQFSWNIRKRGTFYD